MALVLQRHVPIRVRSKTTSSGEWGGTQKDWESVPNATIIHAMGLQAVSGNRHLARMGAEYDADWYVMIRAKNDVNDGDLIETMDSDGTANQRFIVQKVLPRGRYRAVLLKENPNVQD